MSRVHAFIVRMIVPDDDQTDPTDMVDVLNAVLNAEGAANSDWHKAVNEEMTPESRPTFEVMSIPNIRG